MRTLSVVCLLLAASALAAQTVPDEKIYTLSQGIKPPQPISHPGPNFPVKYTSTPTSERVKRTVALDGYVGKDGRFHDATVSKSAGKDFDAEALAAIKKWKFHPATKDGQNVNCRMVIEMSFELNQ
jgi:iron complex outermembrane recepter protein